MSYLIWSIVNLLIILLFVHLLISLLLKRWQAFKGRLKIFAILVLTVGLISVISSTNDRVSSSSYQLNTINKELPSEINFYQLDDNLIFQISLAAVVAKEGSRSIPLSASSHLEGFVSGFDWKINQIIHDDTENTVTVTGMLGWHLLGITFYTQHKKFTITL